MSKFPVAALLAALLLFSCASGPKEAPSPAAASAEPAVEAVSASSEEGWEEAPAPAASPAPAAAPLPEATSAASEEWSEGAAPAPAASPARNDLLEGARIFVSAGKWKSAYDLLAAADAENLDPLNLAQRIDIVLAGSLRSEANTAFALKDLAEGEELAVLRSVGGEYELFPFDPPALAAAQASAGIQAPPALEKSLGDYYYDTRLRFEGQAALPDEELMRRGAEAYGAARKAGLFDTLSLGNEAELLLRLGDAALAETVLAQAEALEPSSPAVAFNHAVAFAMLDRPAEALPLLDKVIGLYEDPARRYDVYTLGARLASAAGQHERAEAYLAAAELENPDNPEPGYFRQYLAISRGDAAKAAAAADALARRFPASPIVVGSLVSAWFQAGQSAEALAFLDRGLAASASKDEEAAIFGYFKALLLLETAEDEASLKAVLAVLDEAEGRFKAVYPADHEVFGAIAEIKGEIEARGKAGQEAD